MEVTGEGKQLLQIWILKGMVSSVSAMRGSDRGAQLRLGTGRKLYGEDEPSEYKLSEYLMALMSIMFGKDGGAV